MIEVSGIPDENGMVLDYYELKKITEPIFEKLDHSFMVWSGDKELIEMLNKINSQMVIVDFQSTAENICIYLLNEIKLAKLPKNIKSVKVRVLETENTYAEEEILI
jgi:6-pyruvoyltetrahydropterin/6-carboxytetrahydropterin synthase